MDCLRELFYGSTMTSLILKVARLAQQTFQSGNVPRDRKQFLENFSRLRALAGQVGKADVALQAELIGPDVVKRPARSSDAPVTYIEIFENECFTMGIFVLKPGSRIPLHDHPGMHGIIRVIHGTVSVQSYSRIGDGNQDGGGFPTAFAVRKLPLVQAGEDDDPCCLTPDDGNYHEVKPVGGNAAFLDILAPPYDHEVRECHFFEEVDAAQKKLVDGTEMADPDATFLVEVPQPRDYWCDSKPYLGPEVDF